MKRTPMKRTTNVEALDAAIAELRGRLQEVERASVAAEKSSQDKQRAYESLAYQHHVGSGGIDEGTLAHAFAEYEAARRRQNDADVAMNAVLEKLRDLEGQREEATRADAAEALAETAPAFDALSAELDRQGDELAEKLRAWLGSALQRHGLARRAGKAIGMTPQALAATAMLSKFAFIRDLPRPVSDAPELSSFQSIGRRFYAPPRKDEKKADAA
jgi:hypothetical protein